MTPSEVLAQLDLDLGPEWNEAAAQFSMLVAEQSAGTSMMMLEQFGATADFRFDVSNPYIQQQLEELGQRINGINETTRDQIKALVGRQADEGWSIEQLAVEIRGAGRSISEQRALLIANTEAASAHTKGALLAYKESGVVAGVEWLVTRPCPICSPLAGVVVELGSKFQAAGWSGDGPPVHPNCRCAVAPIIKGALPPEASVPSRGPEWDILDSLTLPNRLPNEYREALNSIGRVHGTDQLPSVPVRIEPNAKTQGMYRYNFRTGTPSEITVRGGPGRGGTIVHETGHLLDHQGGIGGAKPGTFASRDPSNEALAEWREAVSQSRAPRWIEEMRGAELRPGYFADDKFIDYLLDPIELFARSYEQYIATRSGNATMLAAIDKAADGVYAMQWGPTDFAPIAQAFDNLFRSMGWKIK